VVRGEGELTLTDLIEQMEKGELNTRIKEIPGLFGLDKNGKLYATEKRDRINDLDDFPFPERDLLDMDKYMQAWRDRHGHASLSLITSRGCPYRCTWCSKEIFGFLVRQRSPEKVLDEIRLLLDRYHPDRLWFADDILTLKREWILKLTKGMVEQGLQIPFECLSRVDRVDEEIIVNLKKAGCFRIWYGAESGSDRMIAAMKKDFTVAQVRETVSMTMKVGVEVGLFILIGYPGERLIDLLKTLKMIRELSTDYCGGSVAFPIKGTQFYDDVEHLLAPDYSWSRRNENRLSFRGRYPTQFYWFAVRLLHNWSSFWSVRARRTSLLKRLVHAIKFIVAGLGVMTIGITFEIKQKLFQSAKDREAAKRQC